MSVYFDREKMEFIGLDELTIMKLEKRYPLVKVRLELARMANWLCFNEKGQKRKGNLGFINNWLDWSNPKPIQEDPQEPLPQPADELQPYIKDYLAELWGDA